MVLRNIVLQSSGRWFLRAEHFLVWVCGVFTCLNCSSFLANHHAGGSVFFFFDPLLAAFSNARCGVYPKKEIFVLT